MTNTTWKRLSMGLLSAVLAVGCATGAPQRSPGGNTVQGSTTGDLDACSVALGNATTAAGTTGTAGGTMGTAGGTAGTTGGTAGTAGGTAGTAGATAGNNAGAPAEVTANGVIVGNVAVVALPTHDNLPTTSHGGGPTGTPAGAPGTTGAGGGVTGTAGGPAGTGTALERTGTTSPGTTGTGTTGGTAGTTGTTGGTTGSPVGATGSPNFAPGAGGTANANTTALDRIRTSCRGLTEIRVVTDASDRARLAQISMAMRRGVPVTEYMDDVARISRKATIAGGASGAGSGGGGTTTAPGAGATGTAPGQMGPGHTETPANR